MPRLCQLFLPIAALTCPLLNLPALAQQNNSDGARPSSTFRIAGFVVSAATGAPLSQARVLLGNVKNRSEVVSVITQENGRFEFAGLPAGKYSLQGAHRGYLYAAYEQHEEYSTAIVTGAGLDTENLILRFVPMASLSGTVLDESGEPVRAAQLRLYAESHFTGNTRIVVRSTTNTDDQGTFEFASLAPGRYFVSASATPWYAVHAPSFVGDVAQSRVDPSLDVAYPATFFGGTTESDAAEPINVQAGDRAQVEIRLNPVPAVRLIFHVPDHRGFQVPVLERQVFHGTENVPTTGVQSSDSPGVMEITGLLPGRYTVRLSGNGAGEMQEGEIELRQDGQDLNQSAVRPLAQLKLSVQLPKGEALPKQMDIGLQDDRSKIIYAQVNANSEAAFDGVSPGKYSVRIFAPAKAYSVTQLASSDTQILGSQFELKPADTREWTVSLVAGNSIVAGVVKRGSKAASGVMVMLIPKDPEAHQDLFRLDQSDLDGSFSLRNVIPGLYSVVALDDAWGSDWFKPPLLARYAAHGQAVTISELMQGTFTLSDPVQVQPR